MFTDYIISGYEPLSLNRTRKLLRHGHDQLLRQIGSATAGPNGERTDRIRDSAEVNWSLLFPGMYGMPRASQQAHESDAPITTRSQRT
jgi:hypothetical protein